MKAIWNGTVVAESAVTEFVEGNHYFPKSAIKPQYFRSSDTRTVCPWKGTAHYYTIVVDVRENPDASWFYPDPSERAKHIADHVAFWKGVQIVP